MTWGGEGKQSPAPAPPEERLFWWLVAVAAALIGTAATAVLFISVALSAISVRSLLELAAIVASAAYALAKAVRARQ